MDIFLRLIDSIFMGVWLGALIWQAFAAEAENGPQEPGIPDLNKEIVSL